MKYKYRIPVELKELDDLLISNKDEKIWEQNLRSKWVIINLLNYFIISGILIYYLRDVFNILISIACTIPAIILAFRANTMKYSILPDKILFEWGFNRRKKVPIPFSDINAIKLVTYNDSNYSTIFFGTNNTYKIKKINYDMNEPRPHITFENVKNGKKVYNLLHLLWERNKYSSLCS